MQSLTNTIVAPITALGGAVAIVRLSGPLAWEIGKMVMPGLKHRLKPGRVTYGQFSNGDDGLALPFAEGTGFTGEQALELSIHGSRSSVESLLEACRQLGARDAAAGEFTYRAFMNGRLDLTQAEGVNDTVRAQTDAQLRQANSLRNGDLRDKVRAITEQVTQVLVSIEATTDFSEEIGDLDRTHACEQLNGVLKEVDDLLEHAQSAHLLREGLTVAIVGRPNVGKSSLFNRVMQSDRAIVTDIPGTTRDTVSELVSIHGIPVRLVDTAGLRDGADEVERLGIERSFQALSDADHVWLVYDRTVGWTPEDQTLLDTLTRPVTLVANKCDLPGSADRSGAVAVSAQTGEGIPSLLQLLTDRLDDVPLALPNRRHTELLTLAKTATLEARTALSTAVPEDVASVSLRAAARALNEITGDTASEDILERIFQDFCIGK